MSDTTPSPEQSVQQYLAAIIDTVHGKELDAELRAAMLADLTDRFNQRTILTVLSQLTEPEQVEFEQLATSAERHGEIEAFLRARIPQYDDLMVQTMQQFREEYVLGAGEAPSAPAA